MGTAAALAVMMVVLAGGCVPAGEGVGLAAGPTVGGELRVAVAAIPATPDPHLAEAPHLVHRLLYDTLLVRGPLATATGGAATGLALYPHLAYGWVVSPDGRAVDLLLRRDVTFHDGVAFDAPAVKANLERVLGLPEGTPARELLADVTGVEVVHTHQIRIHLRRATPAIWNALASPLLAPVSPRSWREGRWAGTGPYALGTWTEAAVSLHRNEAYRWPPTFHGNAGPAYPEAVTVAGEGPAHLRLDGEAAEGMEAYRAATEGLMYLAFNLREGSAGEPAVRRAVAHAVDRAALAAAAEAAGGAWIPAHSPLTPGIWGHDPTGASGFVPRESVDRAREALTGAGWSPAPEDGLFHRDGAVLRLEVLVQDRPATVAVAGELVKQLAAAGISLRLRVMPPRDALMQAGRGQFDLLLAGYHWAPDPDILHYFFHSSRVGTTNRGAYRSADVDRLLDAGRLEMQPAARWLAYSRVQRLLLTDLPWVPLLAEARLVHLDSEYLRGVLVGPAGEIWLHDAWLLPPGR